MAGRDTANTNDYAFVLNVANPASATTADGVYIDRQGYGSITFVFSKPAGTATTASFTISVLESSATSGGTVASGASVINYSSAATLTGAAAGTAKIGYIGSKRYCTARVTAAVATGAQHVIAVKGSPIKQP